MVSSMKMSLREALAYDEVWTTTRIGSWSTTTEVVFQHEDGCYYLFFYTDSDFGNQHRQVACIKVEKEECQVTKERWVYVR